MKLINLLLMASVLFLLITASACVQPVVQSTKSGFDNVETISTKKLILNYDRVGNDVMDIRLLWDETMPKDNNIAIVQINKNVKISKDTMLNLNIDGEIFKFNLTDKDSKSTVGSHYIPMANVHVTDQTDELVLYFNLSDAVVSKIQKSTSTIFMVNLANNARFEGSANWAIRLFFNDYIELKNKAKRSSKLKTDPASNNTSTSTQPQKTIQPQSADNTTIVNINNANLRKTPNKNSGIIKTLNKGDEVKVVKQKDEWLMVELASGEVGWCHKSILKQTN